MGHIRKMLAEKELEPRLITAGQIWTDLCEDIHLHYRNNRFDFSETEWAHFRAAINMCGVAIESVAEEKDYKEGDPNFLVQQIFNTPLKYDSEYYPNRCTIELQKDNTVHFHYRDLRLHWTQTEFIDICKMFVEADEKFKSLKPFPYQGIKERLRTAVDIDLIQPYDEGHKPCVIDKDHREGIDYLKELMNGKEEIRVRPILINDEGQRLDGFKRYMAHKELGYKQIECIIDPWGKMGGQHNQSFIDDPPTKEELAETECL